MSPINISHYKWDSNPRHCYSRMLFPLSYMGMLQNMTECQFELLIIFENYLNIVWEILRLYI